MNLKPYQPYMWYQLYRAMADEGIPDEDMFFDEDVTLVSDAGFFSIACIKDGDTPYIRHFLVWSDTRWLSKRLIDDCWEYLRLLGGYDKALLALYHDQPKSYRMIKKLFGDIEPKEKDCKFNLYVVTKHV